jgi:hypothetical protein
MTARWIAEVLEIPGVMCYGATREDAIANREFPNIQVNPMRISLPDAYARPISTRED